MKKILATIIKEWRLMRYDVSGLLLLLLMPAVLMVIMTLVQDAPFKDFQDKKFDLLFVDNDGGALADEIKTGLNQSKNFHLIDSLNGKAINMETMKSLLQTGTYNVGIEIPKGGTAEMVNTANQLVNYISKLTQGPNVLATRATRDSIKVNIYYDPTVKPTLKLSIQLGLNQLVSAASSKLMLERFKKMQPQANDATSAQGNEDEILGKLLHGIGLKEQLQGEAIDRAGINSVQHNVPSWALFGLFFIVVPIVGNIIREREEGSAMRVDMIPNSKAFVSVGKIIFYMIVCALQFSCMMAIGKFLMPLLDLPALQMGDSFLGLLLLVLAAAYTATALGYFIGNYFTTTNQGLPFAAISIVILSAISGIWVPIDLLTNKLQLLARISPMYWSLQGINDLFLRNGGLAHIAKEFFVLWCMGTLLWALSVYVVRRRKS